MDIECWDGGQADPQQENVRRLAAFRHIWTPAAMGSTPRPSALAWPIVSYAYLAVRKATLRPGATCATVAALVAFWVWFWAGCTGLDATTPPAAKRSAKRCFSMGSMAWVLLISDVVRRHLVTESQNESCFVPEPRRTKRWRQEAASTDPLMAQSVVPAPSPVLSCAA